jgi:salicylate biosynthesis isochorismate synthase/menaquinone-specific isochorismate synthase
LRSDKDRFEHEIVVQRIRRGLAPISVWVECDDDPSLARISNIQHLATPIRAQLAEAMSVTSLASLLHPTPAVGGEPSSEALDAIARIEGMDRGWYAGPVGWMDFTGDGEFCVALRSALLRDRAATLFAGAGIVADSDPSGELAETELKLDALLPLLS